MNSDRWQSVKRVFSEAVEMPVEDRASFIETEFSDHPSLRREVFSLLEAHDDKSNIIEDNALNISSILAPETPDLVGRQIGPWRLVREIGIGGMGAVFLGKRSDGEFDQEAAIKLVRHTIADSEVLRRFREERQILAKLQHPNIATLLDGGVSAEGQPYIAMQLVDGEKITDACRDLSIAARLDIILKVCDGLGYAHRNLVVHRDIKPSNILVDRALEPRLLDFGLAKLVDGSDSGENTATAFRALTPAYASPEQLTGATITTASDIYSLGVVLYEVLTGHRPFKTEGRSFDEIVRTVTAVEPTPPSRIADTESDRPRLKGDIDNIVAACLRKEPERRYSSAEALAADIKNYLSGRPIEARPSTIGYRFGKLYQRNRLAFGSVVLLIAAILAGLGFSAFQAQRAAAQRDLAQAEREKTERINKFLQQMLSFSNQSFTSVAPVSQSKNVTVNEMLDQITPAIERELADQPEVRARVLRTIGASYASQGFYDKAAKNLHSALDTQRQVLGNNSVETADTMIELGVLDYRSSRFDESRELLSQAVDFYCGFQQQHPESSPAKLIQAMDFLAANKFYGGDADSARNLWSEGLDIARNANLQGKEREVLAGLLADYGYLLIKSGETERGENFVRESLSIYAQISDQPRWEVGNAKALLSLTLLNRNDLSAALRELTESEVIIGETLGDTNLYMASTLKGEANVYLAARDPKSAEKAARGSLDIYRKLFAGDNQFSAGVLVTLGTILTRTSRASEGYHLIESAIAIFESQATKNPTLLIPAKLGLVENLLIQKRVAEARLLAAETLDQSKIAFGVDNPITRQAQEQVDRLEH